MKVLLESPALKIITQKLLRLEATLMLYRVYATDTSQPEMFGADYVKSVLHGWVAEKTRGNLDFWSEESKCEIFGSSCSVFMRQREPIVSTCVCNTKYEGRSFAHDNDQNILCWHGVPSGFLMEQWEKQHSKALRGLFHQETER